MDAVGAAAFPVRRGFSANRIVALLQRQLYLYRRSLIRSLEIVYCR